MRRFYNYLYFCFYDLGLGLKNRQARESALLYLSAIIAMPLFPVLAQLYNTFFGPPSFTIFAALSLPLAFFIYYLNKRAFDKKRLQEIKAQFSLRPGSTKYIRRIFAIFLLIGSVVLFFVVLTTL
jgi:hypothetical protein